MAVSKGKVGHLPMYIMKRLCESFISQNTLQLIVAPRNSHSKAIKVWEGCDTVITPE